MTKTEGKNGMLVRYVSLGNKANFVLQKVSRLSNRLQNLSFSNRPTRQSLHKMSCSQTTGKNGESGRTYGPCQTPKLPVPELQGTLDKYLTLMKTVLSPPQFARTAMLVEQFRSPGGVGTQLQEALIQQSKVLDNWAYELWLEDMYLKIRLPLPINSNPGMVFPRQKFDNVQAQIRYAASLIRGILDYKTMIDRRTLPTERTRQGEPLCMEQHYRLFTSYREPRQPADVQHTRTGMHVPDYVIVARGNQFFRVDVVWNGEALTEAEIQAQLGRLVKMADSRAPGECPAVGVLTSDTRDRWAEAWARLSLDRTNEESLSLIKNSIFILCLDRPCVQDVDSADDDLDGTRSRALHMLHGQGSGANSANRWFDKTMQFIVAEDGTVGLNYEHSVAEGIGVIQLVEHALKYMDQSSEPATAQRQTRVLEEPARLQWNISPESLEDIRTASERLDSAIADLDLSILRFEEFGREFPKSQKISPDVFMQLSLQLTFYKLHNKFVSTYESASIRRFQQGRVDVIRANSPAALAWVKAMIGESDVTEEEKFNLFKDAVKWQTDYMNQTINGFGIDCHLLGLREMAGLLGLPTPELFKDEGYKLCNWFSLSTSQVPTSMDSFMLYGPVVPDGYGACYNPRPDYVIVCVTSFQSCADTDSRLFTCTLESSLLQMKELCLKGNA